MKKLFMAICFVAFALSASAQDQIIKTSPLALAFGNLNVTYERVLNEKSSFLVKANYIYQIFGVDVNAGGLAAGWRYYFTHAKKDVPAGFYINPEVEVGFASDFTNFGVGAELGYQWVWDSGFVLDIGLGPKYYNFSYSGDDDDLFDDDAGGIGPSLTLALGYAF